MNEIPKVVFSKTLEDADWAETRIASGDLSEEIAAIKREEGNDVIAHGGATFAQALSRLGLVDEYRLNIQPAALGAGMPLFDRLPATLHLELIEATAPRALRERHLAWRAGARSLLQTKRRGRAHRSRGTRAALRRLTNVLYPPQPELR